jgi:hypothetical protein
MCCWPEEDCAKGVEGETHQNGNLIAFALHDFGCDRREEEVASSKIDDLQTGGLEFGDVEDSLEMLVEDVKEAITETPEEEEGYDEREREDESFAPEEAACERRSSERYAAACHFE